MLICRSCKRFNSSSLSNAVNKAEAKSPGKWKYKLDEQLENDLQNEQLKPRHHPGVVSSKPIALPNSFLKATKIILEDQDEEPKKQLLQRSENFARYLKCKKPPMEQNELKQHISLLKNRIISNMEQKNKNLLYNHDAIKSQMTAQLKKNVYNWYPVKYDIGQSLCYLLSRSAGDYAVLIKILSEIKSRDPDWKPKTLFDFGSGVGTVTWAVNTIWPKSFIEYFNVDSSAEMNDLAELLLKGGRGEKKNPLQGVYYRQFFPSKPVPYDLVVSAYTLMELPSLKSRLDAIQNLWNKATKYLVIIEHGSYAGFKVINEVRDFILSLGNSHVFSPCPHDRNCPKYISNDGIPCNFGVRYFGMPFSDNRQTLREETYSYIVLKKGEKTGNDADWPRLVNPTLLRHKHVVCNLCTQEGKIEQSVFTACRYGKLAYRCAKASDWGDRLPMNIKDSNDRIVEDPNIVCDEKLSK